MAQEIQSLPQIEHPEDEEQRRVRRRHGLADARGRFGGRRVAHSGSGGPDPLRQKGRSVQRLATRRASLSLFTW